MTTTKDLMETIRWKAASFDRACSKVYEWLERGTEVDRTNPINDDLFIKRCMIIRNYAPTTFSWGEIPMTSMRMVNVLSSAFKVVQMMASRFKGRRPADLEAWVKDLIVADITETMGEKIEYMRGMTEAELAAYSFKTLTADEIEDIATKFAKRIVHGEMRSPASVPVEPEPQSFTLN